MSAWVKAGLIGAAVAVVLGLIGLLPGIVSCCTVVLVWVVFLGVGALSAYWQPGRATGTAAGQGALAGLLTGAVSGVLSMIIALVRSAGLQASEVLSTLPPDTLQQLRDAGIDPQIFVGPFAGVLGGGLCCSASLILGAALGALGAAIYVAIRPDQGSLTPPADTV